MLRGTRCKTPLASRNPSILGRRDFHQADETRWLVLAALDGKKGYGWWLWVVLGADLEWLRRIRHVYHVNRERLQHPLGSVKFQEQDVLLRRGGGDAR